MEESVEKLEQSLKLYRTQLYQINEAMNNSNDNFDELSTLHSNIIELISLTEESLESMKSPSQKTSSSDPLDREYELFKEELHNERISTENAEIEISDSIEEELNSLIGTKCQAPYKEQWAKSSATYHNALIITFHPDEMLVNIKVKVMFVNPTCREMVPCPYYLDGECKFTDNQCHFSHGYLVCFSDLRAYREPNFSSLKENDTVLAKDEDNLWKRALITAMFPENNQCSVKFELGRKHEAIIDIHHILPLNVENEENYYRTPKECAPTEIDGDVEETKLRTSMIIEKSLTQEQHPNQFGDWEKYTTGIGSKLMAKMGYIVGTGLGKFGDGRVEPVEAVVLPPGKSLDHCMALREKAEGDSNLLKIDKLEKKVKRRQRSKNPMTNVTPKKSSDVFEFINNSLSGTSNKKETESRLKYSALKTSTSQELNVEELRVNERIDKKQYELMVLKEKLSRNKQNTIGRNVLHKQIREVEGQLHSMQTRLRNLHNEKQYRKTMKDLTEF